MPKSFKVKSLHIDILKDQKEALLKLKHDGTFRHNFVHLVGLGIIFRVEPL